jgi:thioredoxin-like negative regulator of GroEL
MRISVRKTGLAILAIALIAVGGMFHLASAIAASTAYSDAAFQAAQASGAPILVEVHASWCPTCKAQTPIIEQLTSQDKLKNMKIFRVDFDSQKAEVRKFGAQMQSTLIVFKGKSEVGRSVGDTKRDSIAALLDKGL